MNRWGKAGVRLTPEEAQRRDAATRARRNRAEALREQTERIAYQKWQAGLVVPHYITLALDAQGLYGPEVDVACGAEEPEVDMWEAGVLYPTWEQLLGVAELTGKLPGWFVNPPGRGLSWMETTLRFHMPVTRPEPDPVWSFTPEAITARLGATK